MIVARRFLWLIQTPRIGPIGRRENAFGLLMSLNMLIETGDGFDYSGADFRSWCQEIGFKRFEFIGLAGPTSAAIAYK